MEDFLTKEFPEEYEVIPSLSTPEYLLISRKEDGKTFKIPITRLAQEIGIQTSGGQPIIVTGTLLPSVNNQGEPLVKGNWTFLTQGIYTNIGGGAAINVPTGYYSIGFFNSPSWVSSSPIPLPAQPAPIDNLTSTSTTAPLSANQGRVLDSKIAGIKINKWAATVLKSGDQVLSEGDLVEAVTATLATDNPENSYKFKKLIEGTKGINLLTLRNTNIDATTGVFSTQQASYSQWICTEKINIAVGDCYAFRRILRGGATNDIQGIYGWDSSGNFVGRPANINDSDFIYTHKDPNITQIASQFFQNRFTRIAKINREVAQEILYNSYDVNGNFFTSVRANTFANILALENIDNSRLPLTIELNTRTSATIDATNSFRVKKTFLATNQKATFVWVTARLKSVTGGLTSLTFGTRVVNVGDTFKVNAKQLQANANPEAEITTTVITTAATYQLEILQVGSGVDTGFQVDMLHKRSQMVTAGEKFNTFSDLSFQTISVACPLLFGGKITALGDSITYGDNGWSSFAILAEDLGMSLTNLGLPGKNLFDILSLEQLDLIPRNSNIIFLTGGTNGWYVGGAIDSRDPANTFGLLNRALDYCYTNIPQAQVILLTPSLTLSDTANLAIKPTAQAMRDISLDRGAMLCDWYKELGVNKMNGAKYLADSVHPNSKQYGYQAYVLKRSIILPMFNHRSFNVAPYLEGHVR